MLLFRKTLWIGLTIFVQISNAVGFMPQTLNLILSKFKVFHQCLTISHPMTELEALLKVATNLLSFHFPCIYSFLLRQGVVV